ncbi:MAG: PDZ domain-containing protein, partial [Clostridia bacterium]|nr:PDZ domain-containing protein [Clostridia bacterium]
MRKKIELGTAIFFIITAVLITAIVTYMYLAHMVERTTGKSELFEKLSRVYQVVDNRYVGEIDEDAAMNALLGGYIDGIDQYGMYLNKSDYLSVNQSNEGKSSGIGATVRYVQASGSVKVERVRAGSPCDKAGVLAGDHIIAINDEEVTTIGYTAAAEKLKAAVGAEIKLKLLRAEETIEVSVKVEDYILETVTYQIIEGEIGVVEISEFDNNTANDFIKIMDALKDQGISKFVFDVRNNPGGSLNAVVEVLDYILPEGVLCTTKDKAGNVEEYK